MKDWIQEQYAGMGCLGCILLTLLILAIAFGIFCFEAWILMLLWNFVLCAIFTSVPTIGFWLSAGVILLCNILFRTVVRISK